MKKTKTGILLIPVLLLLTVAFYYAGWIIVSNTNEVSAIEAIRAASTAGSLKELTQVGEDFGISEKFLKEIRMILKPPLTWEVKTVYCERNSDKITAESRIIIEQMVKDLADRPNLLLIIEGNCADDGRGNTESALLLSEQRAEAVAQILADAGINPVQLIVTGNGIFNPINADNTEEEVSKNRRVDIIVREIEN